MSALWLALLAACTTAQRPIPPASALPTCPGVEPRVGRALGVRVVVGPGVTEPFVDGVLGAAQASAAVLGLHLHEVSRTSTPMRHALDGVTATIAPGSPHGQPAHHVHGLPDPEALRPLGSLVREHARPGSAPEAVVVVVLPHLVNPRAPRSPSLHGLTVRADATGPSGLPWHERLEVPGPWEPVLVLDRSALAPLPPEARGGVLAHELGHALGLPHREQDGALMGSRAGACLGGLDAAEAVVVEQARAALAP